ncbi:DUF952 domain-containing protein [Gracilimonas sediminicola]|uniref:DUF952 domain-containing protein n=1 Tax=Gracilimonas sediminicola TaxID=2952158 RepID=A0A9X2L5J1_9BACT|nr:DUF952 domain-containing protein [Gracilimonas sediminicola]
MEIDLLFTAIKPSDWKNVSDNGSFSPDSIEEAGYVRSFTGEHAEKVINHYFEGEEKLLLIVLDPLRIQTPIKHIEEDGFSFTAIQGAVSIDAIIDKIKLSSDKKGKFSLNVKHFD